MSARQRPLEHVALDLATAEAYQRSYSVRPTADSLVQAMRLVNEGEIALLRADLASRAVEVLRLALDGQEHRPCRPNGARPCCDVCGGHWPCWQEQARQVVEIMGKEPPMGRVAGSGEEEAF